MKKNSTRYLFDQIKNDLSKKMVFLGGPRQVGKTTLAKQIIGKNEGYLNWDVDEDKESILKKEWPNAKIWAFDELHKYRGWRNLLKGLYDKNKDKRQILVTGSARLDLYRFGGDSLQGRYYFLRLHPLSAAELGITKQKELEKLFNLGGFPEPYFSSSPIEAKRWSREYRNRLIREDIVTLESVQDLGRIELLMLRLPDLVGSPLSINSLREDLNVSHKTLSKWLNVLERLYALFRLSPFGAPKIRAVKKEQKHYHFDWTLIHENGVRFENMVACHLLKYVHFLQDTRGEDIELNYFRDIEGREVDFIVCNKKIPIIAVECKYNEMKISQSLKYFKNHFPACACYQITFQGEKNYVSDENIQVVSALEFLQKLI